MLTRARRLTLAGVAVGLAAAATAVWLQQLFLLWFAPVVSLAFVEVAGRLRASPQSGWPSACLTAVAMIIVMIVALWAALTTVQPLD